MQSPNDWTKVKEQINNEVTFTQKHIFLDDLIESDEVLNEYFGIIINELKLCEHNNFTEIYVQENKDYEYCFDRICRKVMHTLMERPKASIQQYIGMILHDFEGDIGTALGMADAFMTRLADTEILDFQTKYDGINVIANFHLHKDTYALLGQYDKPLPSLCIPNTIYHNYSQAYQTLSTGSVILGKGSLKHHDMPIDYMAINTAQTIPMSLEEDFVLGVPYTKDHSGIHPKARQMAKLNFEIYVKQQYAIHLLLIEQGNKFYLPHKRDARLRSNVQGKFVNYQKDAYHKAAVNFAEKSSVSGF